MRFVFLIVLLAGAAMGAGYPWYVSNFSGTEIGRWRVYAAGAGFTPFTARLSEADAPLRVLVDLTTLGAPSFDESRAVLTITAAGGGRTVLADTLTFHNAVRREESPQSTEKIYRAEAAMITDITTGDYSFTVGQGDADGIDMRAVDVSLRSGAIALDPRLQPLGFVLMAIGFIGFALSRGRRMPANPNSDPPKPRWGRGAADR